MKSESFAVAPEFYHHDVTISASELDEISTLLIEGQGYRDNWLPLKGDRPSGFDHPEGNVDNERLTSHSADVNTLEKVRRELKKLLSDSKVQVVLSTSVDYPHRQLSCLFVETWVIRKHQRSPL
jgi:hypothetical protein